MNTTNRERQWWAILITTIKQQRGERFEDTFWSDQIVTRAVEELSKLGVPRDSLFRSVEDDLKKLMKDPRAEIPEFILQERKPK